MPADSQKDVSLSFAPHVQHLIEVWSYHGQSPRDEASFVVTATLPKASKL
jgi:hypothetical protein